MTIEALTTTRLGPQAPSAGRTTAAAGEPDGGFELALDAAAASMRPVDAKGAQSGVADDPQRFEGFVLRTFVEAMLPKENASFFGSGTAGGIWRSMMAERLGEELAAGGGVGIADLLRGEGPDVVSVGRQRLEGTADEALAGSVRSLPTR